VAPAGDPACVPVVPGGDAGAASEPRGAPVPCGVPVSGAPGVPSAEPEADPLSLPCSPCRDDDEACPWEAPDSEGACWLCWLWGRVLGDEEGDELFEAQPATRATAVASSPTCNAFAIRW